MSEPTHPALEALTTIQQAANLVPPANGCLDIIADAADQAIPALEALLVERDETRKALERITDVVAADGHGFHDGTDLGRALNHGQRILRKHAKAKEQPDA